MVDMNHTEIIYKASAKQTFQLHLGQHFVSCILSFISMLNNLQV